jgi:predicted dehydrogenase
MSKSDIRVGIIGAGANTKKLHIPGLQAQKGVEVVAVANRTRASSGKVAKAFGIPSIADSWEDIIYDDDIDAVCIGTWPYMHAPLTIAALEAGKHVLCEARMAMNAMEAQAMLEVSRSCPRQIAQIVPGPMTLQFDRTIIDMLNAGFIGDLISLDARIADGNFPEWDSRVHWRQERDLSGNNIMSMGIWYEGILRWLGPARSVQAVGQSLVKHRLDANGRRTPMTIPDHVDIMGEMEQGGQYRLSVSAVVGHMPGVDVYLCGTQGTIRLSDATGTMVLSAGARAARKLTPVKIPKSKMGGWRVEEEFINAIRGKEPVTHTDFVSAVKYMEWSDAVSSAVRTGRKIHLPLEAGAPS